MLAFATIADWVILGVLALVVIILVSLRASVSALQARVQSLQKALDERPMRAAKADDEGSQESAFDQFLAEDPTRLGMSKTEQFAAYREWRKEKGMNWSA